MFIRFNDLDAHGWYSFLCTFRAKTTVFREGNFDVSFIVDESLLLLRVCFAPGGFVSEAFCEGFK